MKMLQKQQIQFEKNLVTGAGRCSVISRCSTKGV